MTKYLNGLYSETRKYDLLSFWRNICEDVNVRTLMLKFEASKASISRQSSLDESSLPGLERLKSLRSKAEIDLNAAEAHDLFAVGPKMGTQELAGQRVLQVATIVRNLSFEDDNAAVLACNETLLR